VSRKHFWQRLSRKGKRVCIVLSIALMLAVVICLLWDAPPQGVYLNQAGEIPIITDILPEDSAGRTAQQRHIRYLVIHETGNAKQGADAEAHNEYLHSKEQKNIALSWHYTVDDHCIYHHLPDDETAYHAGERKGNLYGIGIEICVNKDGNYAQAVENAAQLCACLLYAYDLRLEDVKQHYDFSGKNCPEQLRKGDGWQNFLNLVEQYQHSVQ